MNWKSMPLSHKIATIISCLAVLVWILNEVKPNLLPFDPTFPAISVFTACEAVIYWNKKRIWAYLLLGSAIICFGFYLLELFW